MEIHKPTVSATNKLWPWNGRWIVYSLWTSVPSHLKYEGFIWWPQRILLPFQIMFLFKYGSKSYEGPKIILEIFLQVTYLSSNSLKLRVAFAWINCSSVDYLYNSKLTSVYFTAEQLDLKKERLSHLFYSYK